MDRIPPWAIKKGIKFVGKKGKGQIEGGDNSYNTDATVPGLGTINGTNGSETITDQYRDLARQIGWEKFDYGDFAKEVGQRVDAGMDADKAGAAVFNELKRNNPELADKIEARTGSGQPSAKSRDAAQPLASDIIKATNAKPDGPTARQIEADVARYIEAGFPSDAAAAMARQNAEQDMEKERQQDRELPSEKLDPPPDHTPSQGPYFPPQEGKLDNGESKIGGLANEAAETAKAADASEQTASTDSRIASMREMAAAPIDHPARSALLKPVDKWTEGEMKDVLNSAQGDFTGWKAGDPLKARMYETVQDWHTTNYGDGSQRLDGGKPVKPQPITAIPETSASHTTPQGEDLWQVAARMGEKIANAAQTDGYDNTVKGLQRGINLVNSTMPLPDRSPAWGDYTKQEPLKEDGAYGPKTDFAMKDVLSRHGSAKAGGHTGGGRVGQAQGGALGRRVGIVEQGATSGGQVSQGGGPRSGEIGQLVGGTGKAGQGVQFGIMGLDLGADHQAEIAPGRRLVGQIGEVLGGQHVAGPDAVEPLGGQHLPMDSIGRRLVGVRRDGDIG